MSFGWSTGKNTSSGGHTYDRTTGTWQGETQGSFGDGNNWGAPANAPTRVIHDANGPVATQTASRDSFVTDQGRLVETIAAPTGPGATLGSASNNAGTGAGVAGAAVGGVPPTQGPGAAVVVTRQRTGSTFSFADLAAVFGGKPSGAPRNAAWDTDDYARPAAGYQSNDGPIRTPSTREGQKGIPFPFMGIPFELSPHVPSAQTLEDNVGEGDFGTPAFFLQWANAGAHTAWNIDKLDSFIDRKVLPSIGIQPPKQGWAVDLWNSRLDARQPPDPQEPVDWGR